MLVLGLLAQPVAQAAEADIRRDATVRAVELVMPSVVNIATETIIQYHDWYDDLLRQFYGWRTSPRQGKSLSLGSGVIIDEDGYIITNLHVIQRANRIQVKLWDGREYDADPIVATSGSDVALLKLRAKPGEKFKAIKFAADDDLLLGETVIALGNPYGLGGSVTKGILSSKNRRPSTGNEPLNMEDWLQTDAAINPGNSGGPLINLRGELIGLNVAVYRGEEGERGVGVSFSIPVKQVSTAVSRFFTVEVLGSLWFGARFKPGPGPLVVTSVQPASPAARAGLREGDQLMQVNGESFSSFVSFNRLLTTVDNHEAKLLVVRGNERKHVAVRLLPFEEVLRQRLGFTLLDAQQAERAGVKVQEGLYIDKVEQGGPAARGELQRGYIVTSADGRKTKDLWDLVAMISEKKKGEQVHLTVVAPRRVGPAYVELRQGTVDLTLR